VFSENIGEYLLAFTHDWVTLMSGIASVVLTIAGIARKWEFIPRWYWLVTAAICFFVASFRVWNAEHRKYLETQSTLQNISKPKFILSVFSSVNFYVETEDKTVMFPTMRIINHGADSIVSDYKAHYRSPTVDEDVTLFNLSAPIDTPTPLGRFMLRPSDPINAQPGPITRGNARTGRLPVIFSGNRIKEIGEGAQLIITVWDYLGTPYTVTFTGGTSQQNFIQYMPGEPVSPGSGLRY
jgi:hypothetical protein